MRRVIAWFAVAVVLLFTATAAADERPVTLHIRTPSHVVTQGGSERDLPPGYFMTEPTFTAIDAEMRRLQDQETRLAAENASLRTSAGEGPGWGTLGLVLGAMAAGFAAGAVLR